MSNKDGKFDQGKYHTIEMSKNVGLSINDERVRLGIKKKNAKGVEYPVETDYFVCPKRIREIFGEEPTELTVYFPVANREIVFPQAYEKYGNNKAMQCQGDGEKSAQKKDQETGEWSTIKCPCEHFEKACKKVGYLRFMMPSVSIGTFFQCAVHGTVSINECNSGFYTADKTTGGRWAMIPFRMRRVAKKLKIPGTAKMKTHWVVTVEVASSVEEIRRVMAGEILYLGQLKKGKEYQLEAPGPQEGQPPVIEAETDEEMADRKEKQKEAHEAELIFQKESKVRAEQLKKDRAAGLTGMRSPEERKAITAQKAKLRDDLKKKIEEYAAKYGINKWSDLIELGRRYKIFHTGIYSWHTALDLLIKDKEAFKMLMEKIKTDQVIATGDIPF